MNMTEKIVQSHLVSGRMIPGEEIALRVDQTLTQDALGTMIYMAFETLGLCRVKTQLSVSYIDRNMLYMDNENPDDHTYLMTAAKKYGIYLSRAGNGICHLIHCARFAEPGKMLIGADSHTPTSGALSMLAVGGGGIDVAVAMAGEPFYLRMPEIVNIRLTGALQPGVTVKDLALAIVKHFSIKGGTGCVLEYTGPALELLSVPERMTLANMGVEIGAVSSIFPTDWQLFRYLRGQEREHCYVRIEADDDARYSRAAEFDLGSLQPLAACPEQPDNVMPVEKLGHIRVDQVFIGSCTNSSYSDLKTAATILEGNMVPDHVSLVVSPGTLQNYRLMMVDGIAETFLLSGARILECACGPCVGAGQSIRSGGVSLRTSNCNFRGRSGTLDAHVYLVSPVVAAASAVTGYISLPEAVVEKSQLEGIYEPEFYYINDALIVVPPEQGDAVEVLRGPNIRPIPQGMGFFDYLEAHVALKAGNDLSTDEIASAGLWYGVLCSNIPEVATTAFGRMPPDSNERASSFGICAIVGGENYGQGADGERAALLLADRGVKIVLAKSFARIHRINMINFGILPLIFENPDDYEDIQEGHRIELSEVSRRIARDVFPVMNLTTGKRVPCISGLSAREKDILLAGGLLDLIRKQLLEREERG